MKKYLHNLDFREIGLWMLIPFTCLISHTVLPFSPTLLGLMGAAVCTLILYDPSFRHLSLSLDKPLQNPPLSFVIPVLFVLYILSSQYLIGAPFTRVMGIWIGILYFILPVYLLQTLSFNSWKPKVDLFLKIGAAVFILEALWRYIFNIHALMMGENPYLWIYAFKFFGPVCSESNATAIHLLILLFFTFWWGRQTERNEYGLKIIFWILLGLTISRAAWVAAAVGLIYIYAIDGGSLRKKLLYGGIMAALGLGVFFFVIFPRISSDLSFLSKFVILRNAIEYYQSVDIFSLLFGVGISLSDKYLGIYAHSYLLIFAMETGLIGLGLLLVLLIYFCKITKGAALYVLIPFLIATMASTTTFLPDLYMVFAIMYLCISTKSTKFAR